MNSINSLIFGLVLIAFQYLMVYMILKDGFFKYKWVYYVYMIPFVFYIILCVILPLHFLIKFFSGSYKKAKDEYKKLK